MTELEKLKEKVVHHADGFSVAANARVTDKTNGTKLRKHEAERRLLDAVKNYKDAHHG